LASALVVVIHRLGYVGARLIGVIMRGVLLVEQLGQ
jgi:hypothetical protein